MKALTMKPGSVVVFEGLDRAGKSTQLNRLSALPWRRPAPTFAHMPSGLTSLTASIYGLTEHERISSPLARQLLHLACHAENMPALVAGRNRGGLVLDRWWWSTIVYGWYAHGDTLGVDTSTFRNLVNAVWSGLSTDVVFLFATPFEQDTLNEDSILRGYQALAAQDANRAVTVPVADADVTAAFILNALYDRGLVSSIPEI